MSDQPEPPGQAPVPEPEMPSQAPSQAPPDPIRHNDRVFIQGKTESGKTVLALHLFEQFHGCRRTAIDVKGRLTLGVQPARSPGELDLAAPLSHYIPSTLEDPEYEELFKRLWFAGGPRFIDLDESFGPTRAGFAPKYLRMIVQQGREADIGLLACSQRPVNVETTLQSEAEHVIVFVPRPPKRDLETLAANMGIEATTLARELDELLEEHGLHSHLWYCRRQDELHRCAPLPPSWV